MWRVSQQMGNTLPYFGQLIKANMSQTYGSTGQGQNQGFSQNANNMGNVNNPYANSQCQGYDGNMQNLQNQFVTTQLNQVNP